MTTVVQPENLCGREPQLGVEEQKHPVLAEIDKRAVSWLLPPVMSRSSHGHSHIGDVGDGGWVAGDNVGTRTIAMPCHVVPPYSSSPVSVLSPP